MSCPICYGDIDDTIQCIFHCNHYVCIACYMEMEKFNYHTCGECRTDITDVTYKGKDTLRIKNLSNKIYDVSVNLEHTTVKELFQVITSFGNPIHMIRFVYAGKVLSQNRTLADYHIKEYSTIHHVIGLRGD